MTDFETAVGFIETGDVAGLRALLEQHPKLATERDDSNATLLIRLIDWPGHRPNGGETVRALVEAGAEVDARRDDRQGTPLAGTLCSKDTEVMRALVEAGADVNAPLGWMEGTVLTLADWFAQNLDEMGETHHKTLVEVFQSVGCSLPTKPRVGCTVPIVFVSDVQTALEYYKTALGFHVDWVWGEGHEAYAGIARGGTELHMSECHCEDVSHTGLIYLRIAAEDVDALHAEYVAAGVKVRQAPSNQEWGLREFIIEDPDGNRFLFHGPLTEDEQTT